MFSITPTINSDSVRSIFNTQHISVISKTHHFSTFKFTSSSFNNTLIRQPNFKPTIIFEPQQNNPTSLNFNHNSISDVLRLMDGLEFTFSPDIYASLIDECTQKTDKIQAVELYNHMKLNGRMTYFLNESTGLLLLNRILLMLVSCGCFDIAHQVFDEMQHRNFVSLAIMMGGLIHNHLFEQAILLFVNMHQYFIHQKTDIGLEVVVVCFLKACVHLKSVELGKMVHGWLLKMGYNRGLFVDTALVELYGKCGCLCEANHVLFDRIRMVDHCDTVLWTGAIVNNCHEQCFKEVIRIFREMGEAGVTMNEYTFSTVLKACGRVNDDGSFGKQVHGNAIKLAADTHVFVMCALIDMYGRCGLLTDAKKVFDLIHPRKRNSACWNAMVTGYIDHGLYIEAIKMIYQMKVAGVQPHKSMVDELSLACGTLKL
ncbi:pentatricopeptide repeat-containing protein At1g31790 [Amaranthus tricolor]|uniref:pentatricopeptide repeat-containing protein At1g31790 n=1 Tax=Amaranthus tricolor TaxID=29722 RepID=UPI00258CE067|nr:pentatricopeptide repeat-containing protein At1g31790 [Amaranthus tricolor]